MQGPARLPVVEFPTKDILEKENDAPELLGRKAPQILLMHFSHPLVLNLEMLAQILSP